VLNSDICNYDIAHAVAASAAFPSLLQYATLGNFSGSRNTSDGKPTSHVDLMDGGATDNLGLNGLNQTLTELRLCGQNDPKVENVRAALASDPCHKLLVLVVDAQNGMEGRNKSKADPRGSFDRVFDTNFLDAYDTLMQTGYGHILREFRQDMERNLVAQQDGAIVLHLSLLSLIKEKSWAGYDGQYSPFKECDDFAGPQAEVSDLVRMARRDIERACALKNKASDLVIGVPGLANRLKSIETDWRIKPNNVACLEVAAYALVAGARPELEEFFGKELRTQDAKRFEKYKSDCREVDS
jgi:hypothetical protein